LEELELRLALQIGFGIGLGKRLIPKIVAYLSCSAGPTHFACTNWCSKYKLQKKHDFDIQMCLLSDFELKL
jgi:hypothetical protein